MKHYYMCALAQDNVRASGWIEERGAKLNASVEVPELGGFWKVTSVGETRLSAEALRTKQKADRNAFGSILPKTDAKGEGEIAR